MDLEPGLWERLVSEALESALEMNPELISDREALEASEAPRRITQYLTPLLERALRVTGAGKTERQVELANRVVGLLRSEVPSAFDSNGENLREPGEVLFELRPRPTSDLPRPALQRPSTPLSDTALFTNARGEPSVGREIARELQTADDVDLLCAFVRFEGVRVLEEEIASVVARGGRVRVLTTTYLQATERRAVDRLAELGAQVRIAYEEQATRLHAKAWLFRRRSGFSTALIGSSNLSRTALLEGLEWNVRLSSVATPELIDRFEATFDSYWASDRFEGYAAERDRERLDRALLKERPADYVSLPFDVEPRPLQRRILELLAIERERHGRWRNLVVAATGTGKTVMAALDYRRVSRPDGLPHRTTARGYPRLLFVAHRREILQQTLTTFRTVLRDGAFGELYVDGLQPSQWEHVFASVQSLQHRDLAEIDPSHFDVVIIDEFHHAAAPTYQRILDHFQPALLLGLTATPERTDGQSILHWFDDRFAAEVRLWEAIDEGELVPFQYFGIHDDVSLAQLTWRRGNYVATELDRLYTGNDSRVAKIVDALRERVVNPSRMRALGFCVSVAHAQFMAQRFTEMGIPAISVSGESSSDERDDTLRRLKLCDVNVVFAVDLFNEGVDVPEVDTVLFLRPTESATLFLQQLGRGLRRCDNKACLTVLDFIGRQHAQFRFDSRFRDMTGAASREQVAKSIEQGFPLLPAGCHIQLDRVAREIVLENLRQAIGSHVDRLTAELQRLGDVSLAAYLEKAEVDLQDVFNGRRSWTTIRRRAGLETRPESPEERELSRAYGRMLHVEDSARLDAWRNLLSRDSRPDIDVGTPVERLMSMLHFDLWGTSRGSESLEGSLARLWRNDVSRQELLQLLAILDARSAVSGRPLPELRDLPITLHAKYTRDEVLAAAGLSTPEKPITNFQEGVRFDPIGNRDLFFITLRKSEREFSPSTRYRDYAISDRLFHWESQSTTPANSPVGQRYCDGSSQVLLFVRLAKKVDGVTAPYTFLGPATHVEHRGERPISITWQLRYAMPVELLELASQVAI